MKRIYLVAIISSILTLMSGCSQQAATDNSTLSSTDKSVFSVADAKNNLRFSKDQSLKMIEHLENERHLDLKAACVADPKMLCVPRSEEHDGIHLEEATKWTNGFYPGLLWKILASKQNISDLTPEQEQRLYETAKRYQATLFSEAKRGSTHDLGFILYDSFGEALDYDGLDEKTKSSYIEALETGRETLSTRYTDEKGLIRSWDWIPRMRIFTEEDGKQVSDLYTLSNPWTYPVIVDNMMNLEFLLDSDNPRYHEVAFNHAKHTSINHYFYDKSDTEKQYPLSYHVFDYGENKPGNWQGVGNVSPWARGQGWSLYGFVTVVEAIDKAKIDLASFPDFKAHVNRLYGSIEHLLEDGLVPYWDFYASRENAYEYAENISKDTTVFSGILGLCDKVVESNMTPYIGYRPMTLEASMLSDESLKRLEGKNSWHGELVIQGDKLKPCGSKPYSDTHTDIPRDTSAAAIYASALYRYATFTKDIAEQQKFAGLADKIMAELTTNYRTDRSKGGRPHSLDLGFILSEATGDMGSGKELDVPIVYGDFYFVEANMRKITFEASK